jgi:hypothetical protein
MTAPLRQTVGSRELLPELTNQPRSNFNDNLALYHCLLISRKRLFAASIGAGVVRRRLTQSRRSCPLELKRSETNGEEQE